MVEKIFENGKNSIVDIDGLVHNLNNQHNILSGTLDVLASKVDEPETSQYIDVMRNALKNASILAQRMTQNVSRDERIIDIHELLIDTVESVKCLYPKNVVFNTNLNAKETHVKGELCKIQNAVLNILINSLQAIKGEGNIEISTSNCIELKCICIVIQDTGIGMTEVEQKLAFKPYFTTKGSENTGLGLVISTKSIKEANGKIKLESERGEGTTITITLPINRVDSQINANLLL